jgi:HK97 family phage major capsid protein
VKLPVLQRKIESGAIDREKRTVSLSFSSTAKVKRGFGYEVLSHDPKAIDTKRLDSGSVPLLLNHDWSQQIGRVLDYQVRGKKAYATAIISRSALGEDVLNDIEDKIRNNISVGYIPMAIKKLKRDELSDLQDELDDLADEIEDPDTEDDDEDEDWDENVDVFQLTRWQPIEVSIVSVPADPSVGIGRNEELYEVRVLDAEAPSERGVVISKDSNLMAEPVITPNPTEPAKVEVVAEDFSKTRELEYLRMREIQRIGHEFNMPEAAADFVRDGKSVADFQGHVLTNMKPREPVRTIEPTLGYKTRDTQTYSLIRAINKQIDILAGRGKWDGIEAEASQELTRIHGQSPLGFYVPDFALTGRRDLITTGTPSATIQTTVDTDLIPFLRNRMVVLQAGARLMTGLVGNLQIPRQNAAATISWNTEVAALTESDQGFDSITLSPNRVGGWTNYSKKLLQQSSLDIEGIVRDDLINIIAIAQDAAAISGSGTNQPTGILNITANTGTPYDYSKAAPSTTFGSGYPTWSAVVGMEGVLETGNQILNDSTAYITTPAVKAAWKVYAMTDPRATNQFFPAFFWQADNTVNGYKAFATNQVPSNKVILGKWDECIVAQWAGLDIVVDIYSIAEKAEVRVIANLFTDVKYRYASAFAYSTNSGVTN